MTIVFTGKIAETRKEIEKECKLHGIRMDSRVTYSTDVLFVGKRAKHFIDEGSEKSKKEIDAEQKNIQIEFIDSLDMIVEYFI